MRFGFSRGSATLVTMSNWSMLVTTICWRPRTERETVPCRGSTRSMKPSFCAASATGRTDTRSPAATAPRWPVESVFSSRRVAQWKMRPSSQRTVLTSPKTDSTRPRQQADSSTSKRTPKAGSSPPADCEPRTVRCRVRSPLPLMRSILQRVLLLETVRVELAGPIGTAGTAAAVLAELGADLSLFGHQIGLWSLIWPASLLLRSNRFGSSSRDGGALAIC